MILIKLIYLCMYILRVDIGCRWAYFRAAGVVGGDSAKGEKLWYVGQIGRCLGQYKKPTGTINDHTGSVFHGDQEW